MAKQLLGKEVTAALNEKIKANVAELQAKGVNPTLCIIRVGENPSDHGNYWKSVIEGISSASEKTDAANVLCLDSMHLQS